MVRADYFAVNRETLFVRIIMGCVGAYWENLSRVVRGNGNCDWLPTRQGEVSIRGRGTNRRLIRPLLCDWSHIYKCKILF